MSVILATLMLLTVTPMVFAENIGSYSVDFETDLRSSEIIANATYSPAANETASFVGMLALYSEDNQLLGVISENSENNVAQLSIPNQTDADKVKAFVWNSEEGAIPLAKSAVLGKNEKVNPAKFLDFTVDVEAGREPVILQLTDTQIIDASQERTADRLGSGLDAYYAKDQMDERCFDYVRETVNATNPDLILLTGDLVYGEFDDDGTALTALIEVMESFKTPWAPVFGNHENESVLGADWQCEQLENAQYCLFKQRTLTGNGNYSVGITQGGELKRVFFMLDSNGCGGMSAATVANGHSKTSAGFGSDQIAWYTDVATKVNRVAPGMKYSFAYHIQQEIFRTALSQYGTVNADTINNPINIDTLANKADTDFGYLGRNLKSPWDTDFAIYNGMKALGCDSHFVGHEHCNSASVMYDGTRFQYGQKSSCYDRANYIQADGSIVGSYSDAGTPIMGGTVMKMSETDGSFTDSFIYYCDTDEGGINPGDVVVPGMQLGTELSGDSNITASAVKLQNVPTYQFTASRQGKVYVDVDAVANEDVFTFSAFVPEGSACLDGQGEFSIRIKPNNLTPSGSGYVTYRSTATDNSLSIPLGEWKTYTLDISALGDACTEFAFVIPAGNTLYLKDLAVSSRVSGMSFDAGELTHESGLSIATAKIAGKSAYAVTANSQGKVLINKDLVANKSTFTFSVYLPAEATNKLSGYGEFAIRTKPNTIEPSIDGSVNGYIDYDSSSNVEALKLVHGEWKTYTVDISGFGTGCTEFAFVVAKGNTIYLKDLAVE